MVSSPRLTSLLLLGILALSVIVSVNQAQALSAIGVSNQSTLTSLNSGKWSRVWTNTAGTGTYFIDASASGLRSYLINNTGATTQTINAGLVGDPVTVTSSTASTTRTDIIYNQNNGGTTQSLLTGSTTFITENAATANSQLVGKTINSVTLYLKKTGAPTGTATIAVFSSTGATVLQFGTQDVSLLTTSYQALTYTSTTGARTIANGDRIGIFFNSGSAGNTLDVDYNNNGANVFDGTTDSIISTGTGTQGAAVFTAQTARDIRGTFQYVYGANNINLTTFNSAELYENQGQIVRVLQSDDSQEASLRSGSITIASEKAAASSALILSSSYDTLQVRLKKTGSPTGTITAGVFDSSGNLVSTFNTMAAASLTTSYATYTFQSSSAISIAVNQYVGISFSGGSVGNTVEVAGSAVNAYDGTNSVWSQYNAGWTDNTGIDLTFRLSQEITGAASQESGANIYADFGSNQNVGGMYVYFPDATKIPQTVKLSTSTDNISYTDRFTISPTQSTGAQYLPLDANYSVRYVKLTVVTWGTAKSMQLGQFVRLPTISAAPAISAIEDSGSVRSVYYFVVNTASTTAYAGQINIDTGKVISAKTLTLGGTANAGFSTVSATKNKVYYDYQRDVDGHWYHFNTNRDLTSKSADVDSPGSAISMSSTPTCAIHTDGAAAGQDVYYCEFGVTAAATALYKVVNSGTATSLGTITGNGATDVELTNLSDKMIARATASGTTRLVSITKSTDVVSSVLYTNSWTTYNSQQFDFTGSVARTFKTNTEAYYATSSYAIHYTPAGVLTDPAELYAETITPGTGTITGLANTIYRISNALVVTGSGTTWTPKVLTATATIAPTAYSEKLSVPLTLNTTAIENLGVVKLVCDANYGFPAAGTLYTGSASDCTMWRILDTSSASIGRTLPYSATAQLVHNPDYTNYNIHVTTTSGTGSDYYARVFYDSKAVDNTQFDSGNNAQLRLLFGQCYSLEYIKVLDSSIAQTTRICADDVVFKESVLATDLGFTFWSAPWGATHTYNTSTHILTTILHHSQTPYNYTLSVYNGTNAVIASGAYTNVGADLDTRTFNLTAYASQTPLKLQIFRDNGNLIYNQFIDNGGQWLAQFNSLVGTNTGSFAGWGLLMFMPVIFAAMFTRDTAGIGGGMIVAFIAVLVTFGLISLPPGAIWLITFVAIIGLLAYRYMS